MNPVYALTDPTARSEAQRPGTGLVCRLLASVCMLTLGSQPVVSAAAGNTAAPAVVVIDSTKVLGPAEAIGDLIGSQYAPFTFDAKHVDAWGVTAWREIGFNIGDIALFNFEGTNPYTDAGKIVGIHVSRRPDGSLSLDYSDFDRNIHFLKDVLHVKRIDFTAWGTPKPLADPVAGEFYFFHAPRSYAEWNDILARAVRHIATELGLKGATYKPWTEPDTAWYWRGHAHPGQIVTRQTKPAEVRALLIRQPYILNDYVEKYINDWKVIKAADPSAKVSGTFNVWSKATPGATTAFTLDDFLSRLDAYNATHAGSQVGIDEIAYQDYNWQGNGLAEGVIAANALVKKHHLPADIPLVLTGWNQDMKSDSNLQRRAAYIASNIIRELTPRGRKRTLARAYIWPFDYDYAVPIAPVVMPYEATSYSGDDGVGDPFSVPAVTTYQKRPMHAALLLLARMEPGRLLAAACNDPNVEVLATIQPDRRIMATVTNYSDRTRDLAFRLQGARPVDHAASLSVQRVDATHSADGAGLEKGTQQRVSPDSRGNFVRLTLDPWAVAGVSLQPEDE